MEEGEVYIIHIQDLSIEEAMEFEKHLWKRFGHRVRVSCIDFRDVLQK